MSETANSKATRRNSPTSELKPQEPIRDGSPDDGFPLPADGPPGKPPSTPKK